MDQLRAMSECRSRLCKNPILAAWLPDRGLKMFQPTAHSPRDARDGLS